MGTLFYAAGPTGLVPAELKGGTMAKRDDGRMNAANYGLYPAVGAGMGLAIGMWLGRRFGWGTWGPLGGAMVGLASGLYLLIKDTWTIGKN
jgi:hypothetical protein